MQEQLGEAAFFFAFNRAVRQFMDQTKNKWRRVHSSRDPDEIYGNLIDNTSSEAMDIAIEFGLLSESCRISGKDNSVTSAIELAAIMEGWGSLSSLQTLSLHAHVHGAHEYYVSTYVREGMRRGLHSIAEENAARAGLRN